MDRNTRNNQRTSHRPDRVATLVNQGDAAMPLMQFIADRLGDAKRTDIKGWLKHGQVKLGGNVTSQFDEPVEAGATVEINFSRAWPQFRHPRMTIVYEDDDIIVVNKGYGLLSVGTGSLRKEETAYGILKDYVKNVNPANKIFVVHRLDRGTSGLMMFAKSVQAQEAMQHNWKNMVIDRRYVALLEGIVETDSGTIRSNLGETSRFEVYSSAEEGTGKPAVTRYEVIRRSHGYTLAEFSLDTGRKNQIRVHARDLGHPIVGDRKYGAKASPLNRIALHAKSLKFAHPITRKLMSFELPVPQRFLSMMR